MAAAPSSFSPTTATGRNFQTLMESHAFIKYAKSNKWNNREIREFMLNGTSSEFENLRFDISWENARLVFQDPEWEFPKKDVRNSSRKVNEMEYINSVPNTEVTHEHKEKTKAVFSLTWHEGNTSGLGLNTSLKLPDEAREVFNESASLDINGPSFETHYDQELKIGVKVPVSVNQKIKVVTILHEKTFKGIFSSKAYLRGRVSVQIFDKISNELLHTVTDDVGDFWWKMRKEILPYEFEAKSADSIVKRLSLFHTLSDEQKHMVWKISGECCFTMGTHGSVKVESSK